jgi:hypothetical protein
MTHIFTTGDGGKPNSHPRLSFCHSLVPAVQTKGSKQQDEFSPCINCDKCIIYLMVHTNENQVMTSILQKPMFAQFAGSAKTGKFNHTQVVLLVVLCNRLHDEFIRFPWQQFQTTSKKHKRPQWQSSKLLLYLVVGLEYYYIHPCPPWLLLMCKIISWKMEGFPLWILSQSVWSSTRFRLKSLDSLTLLFIFKTTILLPAKFHSVPCTTMALQLYPAALGDFPPLAFIPPLGWPMMPRSVVPPSTHWDPTNLQSTKLCPNVENSLQGAYEDSPVHSIYKEMPTRNALTRWPKPCCGLATASPQKGRFQELPNKNLITEDSDIIVQKGGNPYVDLYITFLDHTCKVKTPLGEILNNNHVGTIYCIGIMVSPQTKLL